jgi:hypothetical protein
MSGSSKVANSVSQAVDTEAAVAATQADCVSFNASPMACSNVVASWAPDTPICELMM